MQRATREGVHPDISPTCQGVWLDGGEPDKLLQAERAEAEQNVQARRRLQQEVKSFEQDPHGWKGGHKYED